MTVKGAAQPGINLAHLAKYRMVVPPPETQSVIADFLDRETSKVDALVAKKERLIELLQEKRTALITHAVTKGLDPNAPMKPSGIDWLGDIPAHWTVLSVKFALSVPMTDGPHETPEFLDEGVPFLSAESVKDDRLDFSRKRGFISERDHARFSRKYRPRIGDVYMVKSGATTGNVARVETTDDFNIWSPLAAMRPNRTRLLTDFLFYSIKSKPFTQNVELRWSYGTQQNIGMGVLSNLPMPLAPIDEQSTIIDMLARETAKIDSLLQRVRDGILRLQEYRTALISAAVTGKIDVREEVA
jgi:type I restriction enzyme S subunit